MLLIAKTFQAFGHSSRHHSRHHCIVKPRRRHFHDVRSSCSSSSSSSFSRLMAASSFASKTDLQESPSVVKPDIETLISYHEQTKHHLYRYADGPRGLDWANQPNPFRRYNGATQVSLLHFPLDSSHSTADAVQYQDAFHSFRGVAMPSRKEAISRFLYDSFSLSAWKKAGSSTWSLRVNPSSGNLHPTEVYIISDSVDGISDTPFIAHYCPREHAVEIRANVPDDVWTEMRQGMPDEVLFVGLTSIYWREAWKYGERAFRYCNHDVGHALGAISMAGAGLGWDSVLLDGWGSEDLDQILGVSGCKSVPQGSPKKGKYPELEQEHADCLVACFPGYGGIKGSGSIASSPTLMHTVSKRMAEIKWLGIPNRLSDDHVWWSVINNAVEASRKPTTPAQVVTRPLPTYEAEFRNVYKPLPLRHVIIKRRSAVNMDGEHVLSMDAFYQILLKTLPSGPDEAKQEDSAQLPFRILPWNSEVHMAIFVHKVKGLAKGLYILVRNSGHEQKLRQAMRSTFTWVKPPKCPPQLPLYVLAESNCEKIAMQLSCFQEIAGFGCFSLGMVARFDVIKERGAWMYPRLFWECGVLGQLLYLESHAVGIAATGIGCYFDDPVHEILGLKGKEFQSLYHFTIGAPVEDRRITGLPAYPPPE